MSLDNYQRLYLAKRPIKVLENVEDILSGNDRYDTGLEFEYNNENKEYKIRKLVYQNGKQTAYMVKNLNRFPTQDDVDIFYLQIDKELKKNNG